MGRRVVVNQDFTSYPCSSENLGVAEADVRSCRQLNLLTRIRPFKKLKVNAEDSEMPPKSLLKETNFFKMLIKESLQKHEKKTQLGGWGARVYRVTTSLL